MFGLRWRVNVWNRQRPGLNQERINFLSYRKWDVLYHRYDRGIMGNEFCVILMIQPSYSLTWSRMKKLNCVKSSPSRSLAPAHSRSPRWAELLTLGPAVKELTADTTFHFHSPPVSHSTVFSSCFRSPVMSAKTQIKQRNVSRICWILRNLIILTLWHCSSGG